MPYFVNISKEQSERLNQMAAVLSAARSMYFAVTDEKQWKETPSSAAGSDLSSREFDENQPWGKQIRRHPRDLASLFLRVSSDHLAGIGALFHAEEIMFSLYPLVRSTAEHCCQAWWVLNPNSTLRKRAARALLQELVSVHFSKQSVGRLTKRRGDRYELLVSRWNFFRQAAEAHFSEVKLADDHWRWSIEGERYPRFDDAMRQLLEDQSLDVSGRGLYDALSVFTHPQGFSAREEITTSDDIPQVRQDIEFLERVLTAALSPFYAAFRLLMSYHGWESELFINWESAYEHAFPGVFDS